MDLHPEDLLEREIRGDLSAAERDRLDLHARQCAVCRLERRAREDFRQDSESPEADADVARLLAAMAGPLALQGLPRAPKASPMRYLRFAAAAAAVITATGFAAAAGWSGVRAVVLPWAAPPSTGALVASAAAPSPAAPRHPVAAARTEPAAEMVPAEPGPASAPQDVAPAPARVVAAPVRPAAAPAVVQPRQPPVAAALPAPPSEADATSDAATMFRHANEARQVGDHLRAGELYGLLLNRYPSAPEAHASLAMFGRMLLDDGNANGALQCFDDYLRKGGALREDVMVGRALAFQRIGPQASADEARAWTSLLDAYPGSVHAARARRRLSDLERL